MNKAKRALAVVMAVVMLVPATAFAADSPTIVNIDGRTESVSYFYTGKDQVIRITIDGVTLTEGVDFTLDTKEPLDVGKYTLKITGIGAYEGSAKIKLTIVRAQEPVAKLNAKSQKALAKGLKAKKLKKSSMKIKLKVKTDSRKVKYSIKKGKSGKYLKVNSNGKVTVKKGTPKGTYKVVVTFSGTKNYKKGSQVYKIKIK